MREEHRFTFSADKIAKAAGVEKLYHDDREAYWDSEYEQAIARVRETAGVKIVEQEITGGKRAEVVVDYGDPTAYSRMHEAYAKREQHRKDAERFATEEALYASQSPGREYELSAADVHYFRLAGDARPE